MSNLARPIFTGAFNTATSFVDMPAALGVTQTLRQHKKLKEALEGSGKQTDQLDKRIKALEKIHDQAQNEFRSHFKKWQDDDDPFKGEYLTRRQALDMSVKIANAKLQEKLVELDLKYPVEYGSLEVDSAFGFKSTGSRGIPKVSFSGNPKKRGRPRKK